MKVEKRESYAIEGFTTSSRCLAAQNFIMPALSPTMTEGNIASWKVKDGQTFSAGDVLLEIETDKATMDVEAQEDGVMMKILSADGSKAVQVGTRIAVIADAGDDVSTLEMPADERPPPQKQEQQSNAQSPQLQTSTNSDSNQHSAANESTTEHKHPLMPSVEALLRQHRLGADDVRRIKPTGPNGRLLKGDVLAFVGTIKPDAPSSVSTRFEKLSRLDLSGIKVAASKTEAKKAPLPQAAKPPPLELTERIELTKLVQRIVGTDRESKGLIMELPAFVNQAANLANDEKLSVPPFQSRLFKVPKPVDIFDQILGLDKVESSRRAFKPEIAQEVTAPKVSASEEAAVDIIDELAGPARRPVARQGPAPRSTTDTQHLVLKLVVPEEEKQEAQSFLTRCKWFMEEAPWLLLGTPPRPL
ncbi:hypothetical protein CP533_2906 [Ophiocordyceps camponoti-saundersi (nom. inval.)]|nr:hypothetical protein CP533_2906 [Ophiocordyceps camponoti-saundersi (nom. inval.)]